MNPASETDVPHPDDPASLDPPPPTHWREALMNLISSRVSLIQLESQEVKRESAKRAAIIVCGLLCAFFGWALVLAGGIALLASATGWPWHVIALAAAALHLAAAAGFLLAAKRPGPPPFPVTRAEFQKDREWIENFQKTRKS